MSQEVQIECPKCAWKPGPQDKWQCSCGHAWHTFDTAGQCPKCKTQWKDTQCLGPWAGGCSQWSPHIDWYKNLSDILQEELDAIKSKPLEIVKH